VFGVVAAQAALRERDITGKGQRVSSALFESAAFLMSTHMAGMTATGLEAAADAGAARRLGGVRGVQTAGDGQLFIGVTSDQQWTRFVEEFGLQELAADPRLATNVTRLAERAWLIPALQEVLATLPQEEVARRCERCNVSWAPVGQPGDLFTDPHLLATGGLVDVFISRFGGGDGKIAGLAGPADRVLAPDRATPRHTAPAAAHGRAQCRGAGRSRLRRRRDRPVSPKPG